MRQSAEGGLQVAVRQCYLGCGESSQCYLTLAKSLESLTVVKATAWSCALMRAFVRDRLFAFACMCAWVRFCVRACVRGSVRIIMRVFLCDYKGECVFGVP